MYNVQDRPLFQRIDATGEIGFGSRPVRGLSLTEEAYTGFLERRGGCGVVAAKGSQWQPLAAIGSHWQTKKWKKKFDAK